jgi:hypothetical protein
MTVKLIVRAVLFEQATRLGGALLRAHLQLGESGYGQLLDETSARCAG